MKPYIKIGVYVLSKNYLHNWSFSLRFTICWWHHFYETNSSYQQTFSFQLNSTIFSLCSNTTGLFYINCMQRDPFMANWLPIWFRIVHYKHCVNIIKYQTADLIIQSLNLIYFFALCSGISFIWILLKDYIFKFEFTHGTLFRIHVSIPSLTSH